jgi:DNA topoisomerase-3
MGKVILEQPIDRENVRNLLETGKTHKLTKFISKKKRPFSAVLTLGKNGKVDFEFEPREKKKPEPKTRKAEAQPPVEAKGS